MRSARLGFMATFAATSAKIVLNLEESACATSQHNGMRVGGALDFRPATSKSFESILDDGKPGNWIAQCT